MMLAVSQMKASPFGPCQWPQNRMRGQRATAVVKPVHRGHKALVLLRHFGIRRWIQSERNCRWNRQPRGKAYAGHQPAEWAHDPAHSTGITRWGWCGVKRNFERGRKVTEYLRGRPAAQIPVFRSHNPNQLLFQIINTAETHCTPAEWKAIEEPLARADRAD